MRARMSKPVVARMWEGWTRQATAETYSRYLLANGIEKIRNTKGNLGVQVFRRLHDGVACFVTISYWESREAITAFAGPDIEKPHHLPKDAEYLLELPQAVKHFEILLSEWRDEAQA